MQSQGPLVNGASLPACSLVARERKSAQRSRLQPHRSVRSSLQCSPSHSSSHCEFFRFHRVIRHRTMNPSELAKLFPVTRWVDRTRLSVRATEFAEVQVGRWLRGLQPMKHFGARDCGLLLSMVLEFLPRRSGRKLTSGWKWAASGSTASVSRRWNDFGNTRRWVVVIS